MTEQSHSYLEDRLDAKVEHSNKHVFTFQQTKIKLIDEIEIHLIKTVHPELTKTIETTEDEVTITVTPPDTFQPVTALHSKTALIRWTFALKLVHFSEQKLSKRLHPIYSPDNIIIDRSNTPYLLHYGVEESLPPYERDSELQFNELKASILYVMDSSKAFKDYLNVYHTMQLTPVMKEIREASDSETLKNLLISQIEQEEELQKTFTNVPNKSWKIRKFSLIGLAAVLVPVLIFSFYSYFFIQPRQDAYINSSEFFLRNQFSNVVSELSSHNPERMPYVVQYQLARSYVVNESLTEEQREAIQDSLTLQTDPKYFLYWIYIGRGLIEEAIDIARSLEERDLIMLGLLNLSEQVKADEDLSGEEKQQELDEIQQELDEYKMEQEEQERLEQEAEEAEQQENEESEPVIEQEQTDPAEENEPQEQPDEPADDNNDDDQASIDSSEDRKIEVI